MTIGIVPKESVARTLNSEFKVNNTILGLYISPTSPTINTIWTDIIQPTGEPGYSEITLLAANWDVSIPNGEATHPDEAWIATGNWSTTPYGIYVRTDEVSPEIVYVQPSAIAPLTVLTGQVINAILSHSSV